MLLMAENLRNQGVWKVFMRNQEIVRAMNAVGFVVEIRSSFLKGNHFFTAGPSALNVCGS